MRIDTTRLVLRPWHDGDRGSFAALHADPEVMHDANEPLDRTQSDAKLDRYAASFGRVGYGRWCVETRAGEFLGYVGAMPAPADHPLGPHAEIGWRLTRTAWGHGYATEGARAALDDAFGRCGLCEVLAYTAPDNARSQAVMARLELRRDPSRDFSIPYGPRIWLGLTWVASSSAADGPGPEPARSE